MCGRYQLAGDWSSFTREFALEETPNFEQRYNIAPSARAGFEVPLLVSGQQIVPARFWYIPPWWSEPLQKLPTAFNARSETVLSKPYFRGARPCLVPASGWREFPGPSGKKRAHVFYKPKADSSDNERNERGELTPPGAEFFAFAGVHSEWKDLDTGEIVNTFSILTGAPSALVKPFHHRMPLLVSPESYRDWLSVEPDLSRLIEGAEAFSHTAHFRQYESSPYGNSTRHEGLACIEPLLRQPTLF